MLDVVFVLVTAALFAVLTLVVRGGGEAVNAANLVGLVLAAALTVFLVVALLFPERF